MPTTIKADRILLIKVLEAEQKLELNKFKRDMERYRAAEKTYAKTLATALDKAAVQVRKGMLPKKTSSQRVNGEYVDVPVISDLPGLPTKPKKNGRACELERYIATLQLSSQTTIAINENSVYLKFACEL